MVLWKSIESRDPVCAGSYPSPSAQSIHAPERTSGQDLGRPRPVIGSSPGTGQASHGRDCRPGRDRLMIEATRRPGRRAPAPEGTRRHDGLTSYSGWGRRPQPAHILSRRRWPYVALTAALFALGACSAQPDRRRWASSRSSPPSLLIGMRFAARSPPADRPAALRVRLLSVAVAPTVRIGSMTPAGALRGGGDALYRRLRRGRLRHPA